MKKFQSLSALILVSIITFGGWSAAKSEEGPKGTTATHIKEHCPKPECRPRRALMTGLKTIALYVSLPSTYQQAFDCHGREAQCLDKSLDVTAQAQERKRLVENYEALPSPLRPDNLINLFKTRIEKTVMPVVEPDETCSTPEVRILDGKKTQYLFDQTADALTIDVSLYVFEAAKPRIAVLTTHYYRMGHAERQISIPVVAIHLDLPEVAIAEMLTNYIEKRSVTTPCQIFD